MKLVNYFFIFIFLSCKGQKKSLDANPHDSDSLFTVDIPLEKKGVANRFYKNIIYIDSVLELESMSNRLYDLRIRIWYGYSKSDTSNIIDFKKKNEKWTAEFITIVSGSHKNIGKEDPIEKYSTMKVPKSGWKTFVDALLKTEIMDLPDCDRINNYPLFTEANGITVEIASKSKYRMYHYIAPHITASQISEAQKMENILGIIDNEFEIRRKGKLMKSVGDTIDILETEIAPPKEFIRN